jgi:hypothetical protein
VSGTTTTLIWWRGYQTIPGDQDTHYLAVASTNIPLISFTSGTITFAGTHTRISNIAFTASVNSPATLSQPDIVVYGCQFLCTYESAGGFAVTTSSYTPFVECIFSAPVAASEVVHITSGYLCFIGCIINGGSIGITFGASIGIICNSCIFYGQSGDSISISGGYGCFIANCSFYAPGANGINISGTFGAVIPLVIANCYFEAITTVGKAAIMNSSGTNTPLLVPINNAYYNCTANISGVTDSFAIFDQGSLASAGFVSGSTGNFAPATVLQNIGFPGGFETLSAFKGYMTPGAVQPQNTGGGGTTYIFNVES